MVRLVNTPICFHWDSVADIQFEHDQVRRDVPQILEALQNPSITTGEKMDVDEGEEGFRI